MSKYIQTEGIVLRNYSLSDSDKIAVIFTREYGIIRGYANGARKLKSKFGSSLEPFTIVSLQYRIKEHNELARLERAELTASHFALASERESFETATYWCELVLEFLPVMMSDERVFRLLINSIKLLARQPKAENKLSCYFVIWLLKLTGFFPSITYCRICKKRKSLKEMAFFTFSGVICSDCAVENKGVNDKVLLESLHRIVTSPPETFISDTYFTEETLLLLNRRCERIIKNVIEERYQKFAS